MSEMKGERPKTTKPHHPSRLRNEIHAERVDDDYVAQVPECDGVVPETQYGASPYGVEESPRPSTGGGRSLSPATCDVLARAHLKQSQQNGARTSPPMAFGLSRQPQNDDPEPVANVFSQRPPNARSAPNARKIPAKPLKAAEVIEVVASQASSMTAPTPTPPEHITEARIQADIAVDERHRTSPVQDEGNQPIHQLQREAEPTSLPRSLSEPEQEDRDVTVVLSSPRELTHQAPVEDARTEYLEVPLLDQSEAPRSHSRPKKNTSRNKQTGRKNRKVRKPKRDQMNAEPQLVQYNQREEGVVDLAIPDHEHNILNILPENPGTGIYHGNPQLNDMGNAQSVPQEPQEFEEGPVPEVTYEQEMREHEQLLPVQEEAIEQASTANEANLTKYQEQAFQAQDLPIFQPQVDPLIAPMGHSPVSHHSDLSRRRSGDEYHTEFDDSLHRVSNRGAPHRIDKQRKKKRHDLLAGLTPENAFLVESYSSSLKAGENRAREIVEASASAHAAVIAPLQETNTYQRDVIQDLRMENRKLQEDAVNAQDKFRGDIERLKDINVKTQKFMKGLEGDYKTLKQETENHHAKSIHALQQKIREVESEKADLLREFVLTLESLGKSRRNMKAVLDDCYVRLMISESKNSDLIKRLKQQTGLYEEEKRRCTKLEEHSQIAFETMLSDMNDHFATICENFSSIQMSLDDKSADEKQHECLKQCIDTLQAVQGTPFLTAENVEKAEGRLRSVHETIEKELTEIATSVQGIQSPTKKIEDCIHEVQALEIKILNFNDAVAERLRAQHENEILRKQTDAQKEECTKLEEQVRNHRQTEDNLKTRYSKLEHELSELRDKARDHESEPSKLEQELLGMRQQSRNAEDSLQSKITELGSASQRLEEREHELAKAKQMEEAQKELIVKQSRVINQSKKNKALDITNELRLVDQQYRKALQEKEIVLKNDIRRLTFERDERSEVARGLQKELDAIQNKQQEADDNARYLASEIKRLQEAESVAVDKLKQFELSSSEKSDFLDLKQQFVHKINALQLAEEEAKTLRKDIDGLNVNLDTHQKEGDQLRAQLVEQQATIDSLRQQTNSHAEQLENDSVSLRELSSQLESLRLAKTDLELSLEHSRNNEQKLTDGQEVYLEERTSLMSQLDDTRKSLQAKEQDIDRIQALQREKLGEAQENYKIEVEDLRQLLVQAEEVRNQAVADARRIEAEKDGLIEDHQRRCDEKFNSLVEQEVQKRLAELNAIKPGYTHSHTAPVTGKATGSVASSLSNTYNGKARKSVTRQNKSVLQNLRPAQPQAQQASLNTTTHQYKDDSEGSEEFNTLEDDLSEELGARERLDENGVSAVGLSTQVVPETPQLDVSEFQFHKEFSQVSKSGIGPSSSSQLSDAPEDMDLLDMTETAKKASPQDVYTNSTRNRYDPKESRISGNDVEISGRGSNAPGSANSRDHSKSQANTSTRMMAPPPLPKSIPSNEHSGPMDIRPNSSASPRPGRRAAAAASSSPDYMHPLKSKTYGHHSGSPAGVRKRESSEVDTEKRSAKRHQSSSGHQRSSPITPSLPPTAQVSARSRTRRGPQNASQPSRQASAGSSAKPRRASSSRSKGASQSDMFKAFQKELESSGSQSGRGRRG